MHTAGATRHTKEDRLRANSRLAAVTAVLASSLLWPATAARAQERPVAAAPAPSPGPPAEDEEEPTEEFTLGTLPTLAGPTAGGWVFRVTHRFARDLGQGGLGDLAADLFGFDNGAQVGLELRYGLGDRTQAGLYRTSDRSIDLFLQHRLKDGGPGRLGLAVRGTVEGLDNFSEQHMPGASLVGRYDVGRRVSLYAVPTVMTNLFVPEGLVGSDEDWVLLLGIGARVRANDSLSAFAEYTPRLAGFEPVSPLDGSGEHEGIVSFGVEKQVGGHAFQISVSNEIGTTTAQRALGRITGDAWFIGFNLSRTFD